MAFFLTMKNTDFARWSDENTPYLKVVHLMMQYKHLKTTELDYFSGSKIIKWNQTKNVDIY